MSIIENKLWVSDLDEAIATFPQLAMLDGKTVLVTGATGLICSPLIDLLLRCNRKLGTAIRVIAAVRSPEKAYRRFASALNKGDLLTVLPYNASNHHVNLACDCDYVIHGAGNAHPIAITKRPVETLLDNIIGTKGLLDYSTEHSVKRFLFISSSEVYGRLNRSGPYSEGDYGCADTLSPRNSYAEGKRAAETLCTAYSFERGLPVVIARPGHVYGPTASDADSRISSTWAYDAASRKDITMKSDGSQVRSYCYCIDCATAILMMLLNGASGSAYNISNPNSIISIQALAHLFAEAGGVSVGQAKASSDEEKAFNPMRDSSLNSEALQALGWKALFNAEQGIAHTVNILRSEGLGERHVGRP